MEDQVNAASGKKDLWESLRALGRCDWEIQEPIT